MRLNLKRLLRATSGGPVLEMDLGAGVGAVEQAPANAREASAMAIEAERRAAEERLRSEARVQRPSAEDLAILRRGHSER